MADAVIVATARSPIGRAFKGSLKDLRPDDLTAAIVRAALDKVPQLDPADVDDLMLGCGLPGGESGFNMARVVAVLLGYDHLPGTTLTRYCASSLQTTRMAMHAIKAGEGRGVHLRRRGDGQPARQGQQRLAARHHEPAVRRRRARRSAATSAAEGGAGGWHDPREDGLLPDAYIAMGQTAENVARCAASAGRAGRVRGPLAEPRGEGDRERLLRARDHAGRPCRTAPSWPRRRPPPGRDARGRQRAQAGVPPGRHGHRGQLLPAQRRRGRGRGDERPQGPRAGDHPARPDRRHRGQRRCRRRSWASARSRRPGRPCGGSA